VVSIFVLRGIHTIYLFIDAYGGESTFISTNLCIGRYHTGKSCFGVVFYLMFIVEKMHFIGNQRHSNHQKMDMDVLGQPLHLHQQMIYLTLNWYYHTQLCIQFVGVVVDTLLSCLIPDVALCFNHTKQYLYPYYFSLFSNLALSLFTCSCFTEHKELLTRQKNHPMMMNLHL